MKILRYGLLILFVIIHCGCDDSGVVDLSEKDNFKIGNNNIKILAKTKIFSFDKNKIKLSNIFDSKEETYWFLQAGYKGEISFIFQNPIYIYKIIIEVNNLKTTNLKYNIYKGKLSFNFYKDENTVFADGLQYDISVKKIIEVFIPNNTICSILKTKILTVSIDDTLAKDCEGIFINEIKLFLTIDPFFKPTLPVNTIIKKYHIKPNVKWKICGNNALYLNKEEQCVKEQEEVINNLVYSALKGNKTAEKILYDYSPGDVCDNEWISFVLEWYEDMKYSGQYK